MKKSKENNLQVNRVRENSGEIVVSEINGQSNKRPPQPLTREELEYYHRAREQALQRKSNLAEPKSTNNSQTYNYTHQITNNQQSANSNLKNKSVRNREGNQEIKDTKRVAKNHSAQVKPNSNQANKNKSINTNRNAIQNNKIEQNRKSKEADQAAKRAEHMRKQAYYDSKYADDSERVKYYATTEEQNKSSDSAGLIRGLFAFISWLIFLIVFIIIGYFLAKLLLG